METDDVCFVISPIGAADSPERKKADDLLKYIVRPVVQNHGLKVERADTIDVPGTITRQIIEYLVEAPIVIADLTDSNANVFYELAVRHAAKKPVVHMIANGQRIPFDVAPTRAIFYDLDLAGADNAKNQLNRFVGAIRAGEFDPESPLTNALDRITLSRSASPQDRRESQMIGTLQDIQVRLINLEADGAVIIHEQLVGEEIHELWLRVTLLDKSLKDRNDDPDLVKEFLEVKKSFLRMVSNFAERGMLTHSALSKVRHPSRSQLVRETFPDADSLEDIGRL